ncbi:MAG: hypothetical protein O2999_14875 [Nitrospirae bacterium]|nr:hypothetical protein [Nitrospirota bacterium]
MVLKAKLPCGLIMRIAKLAQLIPLAFLGLSVILISLNQASAQDPIDTSPPSLSPFDPAETQHGFSEFDTLPSNPSEASPNPLPYYKDLQDPGAPSQPALDQKPKGLFLDITLAEDFDEDLEFRRGNLYYPVRPTEEFTIEAAAVYVVFRVFKHYSAYQVIGQLFPDPASGSNTTEMIDEDTAYLALEDESGYLKFFPPTNHGWMPGQYRIDIFVGYEANAVTKMGAMRFLVVKDSSHFK